MALTPVSGNPAPPLIIGIAGGTGSGKTTVVDRIVAALNAAGTCDVAVVAHDRYYRDRPDLAPDARAALNYDHPDALETTLLAAHLAALKAGRAIDAPVYDFATHARLPGTDTIQPARAIIVEGILILADAALRAHFDVKVFVDTDADIRFIRRLHRDTTERGRSVASVVDQYIRTVRPMHLEFVEPSKRYADVIVPEGGHNDVAIEMLLTFITTLLGRR